MGGTSVLTLSVQVAAIGHKGVGTEAPPTSAGPRRKRLRLDAKLASRCPARSRGFAHVGGTSVPTLSVQVAAIGGHKGTGAEAPPTSAGPRGTSFRLDAAQDLYESASPAQRMNEGE
ncbi:DUF6053 domain-containing protein [Lysobacter enzymogenes]|uniref:DUF6053 domain-containing protein n=1 Tax=Lysobacter enzymogenes TaxID=69 RepID=UPI003CCD4090